MSISHDIIVNSQETQEYVTIDKKKTDVETIVEKTVEMTRKAMKYPEQYIDQLDNTISHHVGNENMLEAAIVLIEKVQLIWIMIK